MKNPNETVVFCRVPQICIAQVAGVLNTGCDMNAHTENTLENIIRDRKVRKGKASGITALGAYWSAWADDESPTVVASGGDGVGNNATRVRVYLRARHYRSGRVIVGIESVRWHQNYGTQCDWYAVANLNPATTAEDVIVALQAVSIDDGLIRITDAARERIEGFCRSIGMPISAPSPDETQP